MISRESLMMGNVKISICIPGSSRGVNYYADIAGNRVWSAYCLTTYQSSWLASLACQDTMRVDFVRYATNRSAHMFREAAK